MDRKNVTAELLDAKKTALVIIDLQKGIAADARPSGPYTSSEVIRNASQMADAFAEKGAFVVLVNVGHVDGNDMLKPRTDAEAKPMQMPDDWNAFVPEMDRLTSAYRITKRQWGAFYGTDLDLQLRRRGIDTIVLCGISTSIGVDTTAREAFQHGYHQIFAEDAMTASAAAEHQYVCSTIFPRIGKVRSSEQVIAALQ